MPFYEYRCDTCGHEMEIMQKMSDPPVSECPACGEPKLRKLVSAGDEIASYAGPLGNETEIDRFGTVLLVGGCYGIGCLLPIARTLAVRWQSRCPRGARIPCR